ncbi:helix-loop-helix DNA-binding domain-containing protein [Loa loa]|uniref:Helix-loop-helix DNA-binding domain-containing protein n=1 Tax=Loa loa TaxID=7209 RepID=A0A1S0TLC9_LOALO|nr:helix-loop-helix DNA-binding domain-containing protein [Loa loa]EFO15357.2 helix-loop-helix DNA-binding domain-containing protein [Loa loa]
MSSNSPPETPGGSRDSKNSPDSTDRKKATHLRCERQRREAINIGYQELKELLPASFSPIGCKTTNAAILFRAADYLNHLKKEEENLHETIVQLTAQVSALELIAKQYENMAVSSCTSNRSSIQCQIMQAFLDSCFASFRRQVNVSNLQSVIETLLPWVEILDYDKISRDTLDTVYKC